MKELYLEVFSNVSESGFCFVPLETLIVIFVYEYCKEPPLLITLIQSTDLETRPHFKIKLPKLLFEILDEGDIEMPANLCRLPLIAANDSTSFISGLCSVLRHLVQILDEKHPLLGFKQGCLYGCSESSVWTKFCEIDIIETVNDVFLKKDWDVDAVEIPQNIVRFEVHMSKPVKAHNIQKQKQDLAREEGIFNKSHSRTPDSRLDTIKDLDHTYAEGHKMSLSDLILFPCFYLVFQLLDYTKIGKLLPIIHKWYENMMDDEKVKRAVKFVSEIEKLPNCGDYLVPNVPNVSLYKSEGKKSRKHLYTKQEVIENSFEILASISKYVEISKRPFGHEVSFSWSTVPFQIQLGGREFPKERLERKAQQLENMIKAVLKIAKEGECIVDFCSGSGYLGLILAHCLPSCTIILVENKEESLKRAKELAISTKLNNVIFCQGNIDYFQGYFNLGISLHACGIATDLVIEKCLARKASFVCCPCCYGSIQANHVIKYPRSKIYRDSTLTILDYFTLAHSSDQTHDESNQKTTQGKKCMNIIDADRCLRAQESGYFVHLSTFEPPHCTPKNNLLVGISVYRK